MNKELKNIIDVEYYKKIGKRFLFSCFFMVAFFFLWPWITLLIVIFQFGCLIIMKQHIQPLQSLSNKFAIYTYRVLRYLFLCENQPPFPFNNLPEEIEPPEETVLFDEGPNS